MLLKLDTHSHTVASGHAYSTIKEYVDEAKVKNLELICITDHAPKMPGSCGFLHFLNLKSLPNEINNVELLYGVELNILDKEGNIDLRTSILKDMQIVIASLHPPCIEPSTLENNTYAIINTMKNSFVNIIGHLGDPRYPFDIEKVVAVAKETNTLIEVNNTSLKPNSTRAGGEEIVKDIIRECKRKQVPITLGSDAHFYLDLGNFANALKIVNEIGMPEDLILNTSPKRFKEYILKNKG